MSIPPAKPSDLQATLNRLRKNYAQNPLCVWLFSVSCLSLTPKSYRRYPGTPALWSIPLCAAATAYGGYGTALGDSLNGAGITASWSLAYFLINSRRSLRIPVRHPLSFAVISLAGFNTLVYGSYYFLDADTARRTEV